jgi:hypothetical protein
VARHLDWNLEQGKTLSLTRIKARKKEVSSNFLQLRYTDVVETHVLIKLE